MIRTAAFIAILGSLLCASVVRADETPEQLVLRMLNQARHTAGLAPLVLDAKLSKGCREHASYMRQNLGTEAMAGLNAHQQRPDLPGASPDGAACARAADLFPQVSDLGSAVDGWMAGFYHRRPILDPQSRRIGVGTARLPAGDLAAAVMFAPPDTTVASPPVIYPADGQTDVPLVYGKEVPNPIPGDGHGGYPITLQFPPFDPVTGVTATLTDARGNAVPFYQSDPEHPATSFGQYGVVCLIPKAPLQPEGRYTVAIDVTWKGAKTHRAWSFSTLALHAVDAGDEAALAAALNVPSRVRGTVANGGMMDSETVFLSIGPANPTRYKMISVLIPLPVWRTIAGGATPGSLVGKVVEVQATPELVEGVYVNLPLAAAGQLRVVAGK